MFSSFRPVSRLLSSPSSLASLRSGAIGDRSGLLEVQEVGPGVWGRELVLGVVVRGGPSRVHLVSRKKKLAGSI